MATPKSKAKRKPSTPRVPRPPASRYGIAEWFGHDFISISPDQRQGFGQISTAQVSGQATNLPPACPFLATLVPDARCNKASGVCSIRQYTLGPDGTGIPVPGDKVVTVCPTRFIQDVATDVSVFEWIADKVLDVGAPIVVKETPFLRSILEAPSSGIPVVPAIVEEIDPTDPSVDVEDAISEAKKAGRIDWILVDPSTLDSADPQWCAVETQGLYFSGGKMLPELEVYAAGPMPVMFPTGKRRPDYRSSGPKRLSPQLDVKVPVLRTWGKKVVVVVDRFFFNNMNTLDSPYRFARTDRERRDNAEIIWFVVDYDEQMRMRAGEVIYTTLDSSRRALNATEPLSKDDFTRTLRDVIGNPRRTNKVFTALARVVRG